MLRENIELSIIVPVHNEEHNIDEFVKSIMMFFVTIVFLFYFCEQKI